MIHAIVTLKMQLATLRAIPDYRTGRTDREQKIREVMAALKVLDSFTELNSRMSAANI